MAHKFSASDDVMNQKCLSCHATVPGGADGPGQGSIVKISHKQHADKKVHASTATATWNTTRGPPTNRPTMATLPVPPQAHPRPRPATNAIPSTWSTPGSRGGANRLPASSASFYPRFTPFLHWYHSLTFFRLPKRNSFGKFLLHFFIIYLLLFFRVLCGENGGLPCVPSSSGPRRGPGQTLAAWFWPSG
jgi:hypothetical protein